MINTSQTLDKPVSDPPQVGLTFSQHYDNAKAAVNAWFDVNDPFRENAVASWAIPEDDPRRVMPKSQQLGSLTLSVMAHLAKSNPRAVAGSAGIITLRHWQLIVRAVLDEKAGQLS